MRAFPSRRRLAACAVVLLALTSPACAQDPAPEGGAAATTAKAGELPRDSLVALADRSRFKGSENAPVTLVEISDFQCPFCAQWAQETYPKLDSAYIRTGKVRMVFINLPLPIHSEAWPAHEAALCAGVQGAFWPMHDRIFATQREWSGQPDAAARFAGMAEALRLDVPAFRECMESDATATIMVNDVMQAAQAGLTGTPSFIFDGREAASGALPFEEFQRRIDALLAEAEAAPAAPGAPQPQQP